MSETTMYVPTPPVLDHERLADASYTIRGGGANGPVLIHYDPALGAGAICYLVGEVWAIYGPLAFGEFVASLEARGVHVGESDDHARWIAACTPLAAHQTAH